MIRNIVVALSFIMLVGCAALKKRDGRFDYWRAGDIPPTPSVCFDGLDSKMSEAGCQTVASERIASGYTRVFCADDGAGASPNALLSWDYFIIAYSPKLQRYARPIPTDTVAVCADPAAIIVTARRD